ncbi:AraC family transcriptional regulator [Eubacterium sp. BX4]|uniref:AraC family transcriptional regulator n=1 Tax=Eubacterium segne TaxID=2763045 RepID=A0ABR7F1E3_9FIRM|nr:AraC family transcriptional regulator [Eubacterium segne]MBC5667430.1 AraC family transcriptional regulator [Eubacterium segne]
MSDVREVYVTAEVAKILDITPAYLIRLAKGLNLSNSQFREAGKRNYLFSKESVAIIRANLKK